MPFFFHNVFGQKTKMFIGDGGTLMMGVVMSTYVVSIIAVRGEALEAMPQGIGLVAFTMAIMAVPVFDTLRVMTDDKLAHHDGYAYEENTYYIYKMNFRKIILAVVAVISLVSCKSQYELLLGSNDADAKYKAAFEYFDAKKYNKAATLFESLSALTDGTERDDTVRYYWGLSNYNFKDYYTAETNFQQFCESYPRSPFASQARFLRLDCLYRETLRYELDQQPTYKAMTEISEYMLEYPSTPHMQTCKDMLLDLGERLDRKAYEGAKLYYKMEDYLASRVAFRNVLKEDSENIYREDILYYIAMSSYNYAANSVQAKQKERYLTFIDDYYNFIGEIPESKYRRELDNVYKKAQRALGRNVAIEDEEMTDRDFAKERKALLKEERKNSKK